MCVFDEDALVCGSDQCLAVGPTPRWPRLARLRWSVRRFLGEASYPQSADAMLVIDELASNAIRHGARPIRLTVRPQENRRRLSVQVFDASPQQPRLAPHARGEAGGLGLRLVEALSTAWGVLSADDGEPGKTVWAEVPLPD